MFEFLQIISQYAMGMAIYPSNIVFYTLIMATSDFEIDIISFGIFNLFEEKTTEKKLRPRNTQSKDDEKKNKK